MESVVVALARRINEAFPELDGRAFAVSECDVNKERMPRLPACMVALKAETSNRARAAAQTTITEIVVADFWFSPRKYTDDGEICEVRPTPDGRAVYYAFYDYGAIRDRLLDALNGWLSPQGAPLEYYKLEIAADEFATTTTMCFEHKWNWCPSEKDPDCTDEKLPTKHPIHFCIDPKLTPEPRR